MSNSVLITGITGFAGSHLADYLIEQGLEVHGIRRPRSRDEFVNGKAHYWEGDVTDEESVRHILLKTKPDYIFHLAAQSFVPLSWTAPRMTLEANIIGTLNILETVRRYLPETVIQIAGSSEEYGLVKPSETPIKETNPLRPMSPYGVSKVAADLLARQYFKSYGIKVIVTRAFNHSGPRRGASFATSSFAKQIVEIEKGKEPIIYVGNLEAKRDWTDVRDVVRGYWLAVTKGVVGEVYNICSGTACSVEQMLGTLLAHASTLVELKQVGDRMRPSDVPLLVGDNTKFRRQTGWTPKFSFEKTMIDLLDYWRERV